MSDTSGIGGSPRHAANSTKNSGKRPSPSPSAAAAAAAPPTASARRPTSGISFMSASSSSSSKLQQSPSSAQTISSSILDVRPDRTSKNISELGNDLVHVRIISATEDGSTRRGRSSDAEDDEGDIMRIARTTAITTPAAAAEADDDLEEEDFQRVLKMPLARDRNTMISVRTEASDVRLEREKTEFLEWKQLEEKRSEAVERARLKQRERERIRADELRRDELMRKLMAEQGVEDVRATTPGRAYTPQYSDEARAAAPSRALPPLPPPPTPLPEVPLPPTPLSLVNSASLRAKGWVVSGDPGSSTFAALGIGANAPPVTASNNPSSSLPNGSGSSPGGSMSNSFSYSNGGGFHALRSSSRTSTSSVTSGATSPDPRPSTASSGNGHNLTTAATTSSSTSSFRPLKSPSPVPGPAGRRRSSSSSGARLSPQPPPISALPLPPLPPLPTSRATSPAPVLPRKDIKVKHRPAVVTAGSPQQQHRASPTTPPTPSFSPALASTAAQLSGYSPILAATMAAAGPSTLPSSSSTTSLASTIHHPKPPITTAPAPLILSAMITKDLQNSALPPLPPPPEEELRYKAIAARARDQQMKLDEEARAEGREAARLKLKKRLEELELGKSMVLNGSITVQLGDSLIWRRRWFELRGNSMLLYKSEHYKAEVLERIDLRGSIRSISDAYEECQMVNSFKVLFGEDAALASLTAYTDTPEDKDVLRSGIEVVAAIEL
ncbi:hypothetical protein V8E36_005099 [Tilletia maclaganii]